MALCTQCGLIFSDKDIDKKPHVCNPSDVPEEGKAKKPVTTSVDVI